MCGVGGQDLIKPLPWSRQLQTVDETYITSCDFTATLDLRLPTESGRIDGMAPRFNAAVSVRRFQFSLKWLFVAMLAAACFFGGIRFERERQRREQEAAALAAKAKALPPSGTFTVRIIQQADGTFAKETRTSSTVTLTPIQQPSEFAGHSDEVISVPERNRQDE